MQERAGRLVWRFLIQSYRRCSARSYQIRRPQTIRQIGPTTSSGPAALARSHALRRLLAADVFGLALAAFIGPLLLSLISSNPESSAPVTAPGCTSSIWP